MLRNRVTEETLSRLKVMASTSKVASMPSSVIEPELKEFIDQCLVPALVREYLKEYAAPKTCEIVANSQAIDRDGSEGDQ